MKNKFSSLEEFRIKFVLYTRKRERERERRRMRFENSNHQFEYYNIKLMLEIRLANGLKFRLDLIKRAIVLGVSLFALFSPFLPGGSFSSSYSPHGRG